MSAAQNSSTGQAQSTGQAPSAGRGRTLAILLAVLVALVALIAAAVTVVVSQETYAPTERTMSPKIQVAAGSEHVDTVAGLEFRVPEGWRVQPGDLVFGSTALVPEPEEGAPGEAGPGEAAPGGGAAGPGGGPNGIVLVGAMTPDLVASQEADNQRAAARLVTGMGQFFLPIPGQPTEHRVEEVSSRAGDGWGLSYRVTPPAGANFPGGLVYSAVVGEGDQRYWLTYVGSPADGSEGSPHPEWADEIVERFQPTGTDQD